MSASPIRRPIAGSSSEMCASPPYHDERYLGNRPPMHHPDFSPPPSKKKVRREPDRYDHVSISPSRERSIMRRPEVPMHTRMAQREMTMRTTSIPGVPPLRRSPSPVRDNRNVEYHMQGHSRGGAPPGLSSGHPKRSPPMKVPYESQRNERYRSPSPARYPPSGGEKHYAPTLHERFSSVVESSRSEPRIKYSREDLEQITIDIHRNLKAQSPTLRHIVNPNDVKLVRRANEGHRPMFDREEIKQAPKDMREDAYYEKKSGGGSYNSSHSMSMREVENYEITRHRFEPHHQAFHSTGGRSLSDRWQGSEGRKDGGGLDQDDRDYERQRTKGFIDSRRSKSGDRDFRSEKYPVVASTSHARLLYSESQHRLHSPASESRSSMPSHHKDSMHPEMKSKLSVKRGSDRNHMGSRPIPPSSRPDSRSQYLSPPEKRYADSMSSRAPKHLDEGRPSGMNSYKWHPKSRSDSRERMPSKSDKYSYKSWPETKPRSYVEHEGRESTESFRGRGGTRPYRGSRGTRTRGFRGSPRGGYPSRSFHRGGYSSSTRGRGRGASRRGRFSPSLWEHDMYSRSSQDRKMDLP